MITVYEKQETNYQAAAAYLLEQINLNGCRLLQQRVLDVWPPFRPNASWQILIDAGRQIFLISSKCQVHACLLWFRSR